MILINKNSSNTVLLTLTENCTLTSHDFLFVFVNETTNTEKIFHSTDLQTYTGRANDFVIIDNAIEIPLSGQMDFDPTGYWSYTIYEMEVSSPPDLDPANAVAVVETGKVLVQGTATAVDSFDEDDTPVIPSFDE